MAPIERGKRYLLRIINTSFSSTFNFTIDNHELEVVEADFVPIKPYTTKNVLVAIGQRYHVIVHAEPKPTHGQPLPKHDNYWIRTWEAKCSDFFGDNPKGYEKNGIIRYKDNPKTEPTSLAWPDSKQGCVDEDNLTPMYHWHVGSPANGPEGEHLTLNSGPEPHPGIYPLAKWTLKAHDFTPFKIDYSDPTFLNLNYTGKWDPLWLVLPENYAATDWVSQHSKSNYQYFVHYFHLIGVLEMLHCQVKC